MDLLLPFGSLQGSILAPVPVFWELLLGTAVPDWVSVSAEQPLQSALFFA